MKNGLDYFPFDTALNTQFELIEAQFGLTGFSIVVKLLQRIYGQEGYYCEVNEEVILLLSKQMGKKASIISEVIKAAVKRDIFDRERYEKYRVLTSEDIQRKYFEATRRRVKVTVKEEYLCGSAYLDYKNVDIPGKNVNNSAGNDDKTGQSKVKESKVKESKVKESREEQSKEQSAQESLCGGYNNVQLSSDELNELKNTCEYWDYYIERMSEYLANHPDTYYASHFRTIMKWYNEDKKNGALKPKPSYDLDKYAAQNNVQKLKYVPRNSKPSQDDEFTGL